MVARAGVVSSRPNSGVKPHQDTVVSDKERRFGLEES